MYFPVTGCDLSNLTRTHACTPTCCQSAPTSTRVARTIHEQVEVYDLYSRETGGQPRGADSGNRLNQHWYVLDALPHHTHLPVVES